MFIVKDLKKILDNVDENLQIAALGHYGEIVAYDKYDFSVATADRDEDIEQIPGGKEIFSIEAKDIGPEPD